MNGRRARAIARWSAVAATAGITTVLGAGGASADESYTDSPLGPQFALVKTGQIDDPLEKVLERATVLGGGPLIP
ncbi:hypothetical protein [Streptomyces sp. B6B3]|uniref:hypothetical protein n=1 Tax=Streptomyces sp. B6B3 TaxID=3153570 RepID=UPI00325C9EC9